MSELLFLGAKRTPFGANGGKLRDILPSDLGIHASKAALEQSGVTVSQIDQVIFGSVLSSAPNSVYTPRHISLGLGIPQAVPALGVNRLCGSGFQAVIEAQLLFKSADAEACLVGGVEAMSMSPYLLRKARFGQKMGNQQVTDSMVESLYDLYAKLPMALTAENLAEQYKISREECDAFALASQKKTAAAVARGFFASEIVPHELLSGDEHPRPEATPEGLTKLKALFKENGVVTAGNASGIVDGAAALVVATQTRINELNLQSRVLGRLVSYGVVGCDPTIMGIGPVEASRMALKKAGLKINQMDVIEINEAFAPQTLAVCRALDIDPSRVNPNGGAIAIGHPLGASGARITASALYALAEKKQRYALVSACIGGGQGIALVLESHL